MKHPVFRHWIAVFTMAGVALATGTLRAQDEFDAQEQGPVLVSLRDAAWTAKHDWIADFEYDRRIVVSQKKKCVVYSMEMIIDHVRRLRERQLPCVGPTPSANDEWILGESAGWAGEPAFPPQPLFGYRITNPEATGPKLRFVLSGGNHPNEHPACWVLHALIDFLVSDESEARVLRDKAEFYVYPCVNPDGRLYLESPEHLKISTGRSSPELMAAGQPNHNRAWHLDGQFRSIDTMKAAMFRDTGGRPDYLLDFHGIPTTSYVYVSDESPLSRALITTRPGINQRLTPPDNRMLRAVAVEPNWLAALYALTPELASQSKEAMFLQGRFFARAFYNVVTGNVPESLEWQRPDITPVAPPAPVAGWLFEGSLKAAFGNVPEGVARKTEWSDDCRFDRPGNRSLSLPGSEARVELGSFENASPRRAMTVALWLKGADRPQGIAYVLGRYKPSRDQRSWALAQRADSGEVQAVVSGNGAFDPDRMKRMISSLWPVEDIFDGKWRHVACTFAGGEESRLRLFIDGSELEVGKGGHVFNDAQIEEMFASSAPLTVGALPGGKNSFIGQIDEVALWDKTLSPEEIRWLSENSIQALLAE